MTDLDATGLRANANDPKLTKAAAKAERQRQAKARSDARWKAAGACCAWLWRHLPITLVLSIGFAIIISASTVDWWMSARGWLDLLPGIGFVAYLAAAASVGFWYYGLHKAWEEYWRKRELEAWAWLGVAVAGFLICVIGVGVATLTNTSNARIAAEESRKAYVQLVARRDELRDKLDVQGVDYWEARKKADERTRDNWVNIAVANYKMKDLDVDGGCKTPSNFNQQRACAYYNGGLDPHTGGAVDGILTELEQDQAGLEKAQKYAIELADLDDKVLNFKQETGDATARALVSYFEDESTANQVTLGLFAGLSALFMLAGGIFTAEFLRRVLPKGK